MNYEPTSQQLRGMPYQYAVLMGMPHVLSDQCQICQSRATNKHHMVPKGKGNKYLTITDSNRKDHKLQSPLLSLCGSGTTGCHHLFHSPKIYAIEWQWLDETVERQWWKGDLLRDGLEPHDPILYAFGRYVIYSKEWDESAGYERFQPFGVIDHV